MSNSKIEKEDKWDNLNINCTIYKTRLNKKFLEKVSYALPDRSKVVSFIPGTIVEILVSPGDTLKEGDDLMVLEAMKMKNRLKAPVGGRVRSINTSVGETVPKGALLMEIDL